MEQGLDAWQDPHNSDRRFTRVRVRETVLPTLEAELGPGVAEALARTAELLRDDTELLDRLAAEAYRTAEGLGGTNTLDCAALDSQPPLRHISAVESLVIGWHGQKSIEVPGATVTRNAGRLQVS